MDIIIDALCTKSFAPGLRQELSPGVRLDVIDNPSLGKKREKG